MKAWLRTILTGLFVGGLVYVVLEEKYKRKLNPVGKYTKEQIAKFREEMEESFSGPDSLSSTLQRIAQGAEELRGSFKEMVEEDKQALQRRIDVIDELAVAAGRSDLARDPLNAEFRLAMERKKAQ